MDTRSLAHPAPEPTTTREERALELYRTRGHEIERLDEDLYRVPSCTGHSVYTVRYGDVEACDCLDFEFGGGRSCKHLLAVGIAHAKRRFTTVRTIDAAGDPFAYAGSRCGCYDGWVYLGFEGEDEDGENVEEIERMRCRRCSS